MEITLISLLFRKQTKSRDALEWDKKENVDKPPGQRNDKHLRALVKAIRNCGVSFNIWEKSNGDGKGSGLYDFTSLMGSDKKLLLKKLPDNLQGAIRPETSATVVQIWMVCVLNLVYSVVK